MQLTFNKRTILPVSYEKKPDKNGNPQPKGFNATVFSPVQYSIRFGAGMMPIDQMQAVMEQCAENSEEVEVEFVEGSTSYGKYLEIYSVKPVAKPTTKANATAS